MSSDSVDVPARCRETTDLFTIRFEPQGDGWMAAEAQAVSGGTGEGDRSDERLRIDGPFFSGPTYGGCPDCGESQFFQCGNCENLGCYDGSQRVVCPWCGEEILIQGNIDELEGHDGGSGSGGSGGGGGGGIQQQGTGGGLRKG